MKLLPVRRLRCSALDRVLPYVLALLFSALAFPAFDKSVQAGVILSVSDALNEIVSQPDLDRELQIVLSTSLKSGRYAEAVDRLVALQGAHSKDSRLWFSLAVAQLGERRVGDALASAEKCMELRPDWVVGLWLKGSVLVAAAKLDQAEKAFDEAVRIAPQHAGAYYQRASFRIMYLSQDPRKVAGGIADLQKAQELDAPPQTVDAMLGKAYLKQQKSEIAERHLRRAFEHGAELNLEPLADLTALYDATGKSILADAVLAEAERRRLLLRPEEMELHAGFFLILARHLAAARRATQDIRASFDRAIALLPANVNFRLEYARWLDATEQIPAEVAILRQGLSGPPYNVELSAQLAWALAENGQDLEEARRWLRHSLASDPASPYLADTAAWIEYRAGNYRAALAAIQPSLGLVKNIPEVAYHAGAIHAKLGDTAEAVRCLRLALQAGNAFPGGRHAEELLATLDRQKGR